MDGGSYVAKTLTRFGVQYIATLCGGHITPINRGCVSAGVEVIDFRDERTAAFFSVGTSIMTNLPGVVAVTAGPGLTNAFTAVKTAYHAGVPLVVLGGAVPTFLRGRGALQDTEQIGYMQGGKTVKWAARVVRMRDIPFVLEEAFSVAMSGVPGPVFVEFPADVLYGPCVKGAREYRDQVKRACGKGLGGLLKRRFVGRRFKKMWDVPHGFAIPTLEEVSYPIVLDREIESVVEILRSAERPVLLIGSQLKWSRVRMDILEIVERLGIPVYLTGLSRGALGARHELLFRLSRKEALKRADVVLLAGVPLDFRLDYGKSINTRASIVRVDLNPRHFARNRKSSVTIKGDVGEVLERIAAHTIVHRSGWRRILRKFEEEGQRQLRTREESHSSSLLVDPVQLLKEVDRLLNKTSIVVVDGGDFAAIAAKTLNPRSYGSWLDAGPFGTLGAGAGFALAAKRARPEADVWVIFGDGAFGYSLIEMSTAVRHKLPFISIVGNDACWTEIKRGDEEIYGPGASVATRLMYERYDLAASAFGVAGTYIDGRQNIKEALEYALQRSRGGQPSLVNVKINTTDIRKGSISM